MSPRKMTNKRFSTNEACLKHRKFNLLCVSCGHGQLYHPSSCSSSCCPSSLTLFSKLRARKVNERSGRKRRNKWREKRQLVSARGRVCLYGVPKSKSYSNSMHNCYCSVYLHLAALCCCCCCCTTLRSQDPLDPWISRLLNFNFETNYCDLRYHFLLRRIAHCRWQRKPHLDRAIGTRLKPESQSREWKP